MSGFLDVALVRGLMSSASVWLPYWPGNIFSPASTPAHEVRSLSFFVLIITAGIFLGVSSLLTYALIKFRGAEDDDVEPPQVYGSTQIELAWTIIPILLIIVLFLGTARMIFAIQDAPKPKTAVDVLVVGHQFWWEFRYPQYGIVTANELHVPLSDAQHDRATFMKITSADVIHSFWVPRLAGKTDLLPNRVNEMWIDPQKPGLYLGQCAQFCGTEHAKMLLRVYVDTPEQFQKWVANQQKDQESGTQPPAREPVQPNPGNPSVAGPAPSGQVPPNSPATRGAVAQLMEVSDAIDAQQGRRVFEEQACMNCHEIKGTVANGRYGPDLSHLMSRDTIGSGIVPNTPENLKKWIEDPNNFKPGCLMPAMHLTDVQNAQLVAYLTTLR